MRIAVFIESINYRPVNPHIRHVFLFDVDHEVIVAVGEEILSVARTDYIVVWLLGKRVERIYISGLDEHARKLITRAGIKIRDINEIRDNPVLRALLIPEGNS